MDEEHTNCTVEGWMKSETVLVPVAVESVVLLEMELLLKIEVPDSVSRFFVDEG